MAGHQGAVGFFRSPLAPADKLYPDIQIQMASTIGSALLKKSWNLKDSVSLVHGYIVCSLHKDSI